MPKTKGLENTMISLAGEHAVASQLNLNGYVASLTMKNFPGVDIFYQNPKTKKNGSLQVKSTRYSWIRIPEESEENQLYVLVNFQKDSADFYIIPYGKLREIAVRQRHMWITLANHRKPLSEEDQPLALSLPGNKRHPVYEEIERELSNYKNNWRLLETSE